ncbi:hypothetical protein H6771_00785 [Candidatus Peribacteria bacterium]|nr:hypothetical protein [Candidatus Peribacteria bacterium]
MYRLLLITLLFPSLAAAQSVLVESPGVVIAPLEMLWDAPPSSTALPVRLQFSTPLSLGSSVHFTLSDSHGASILEETTPVQDSGNNTLGSDGRLPKQYALLIPAPALSGDTYTLQATLEDQNGQPLARGSRRFTIDAPVQLRYTENFTLVAAEASPTAQVQFSYQNDSAPRTITPVISWYPREGGQAVLSTPLPEKSVAADGAVAYQEAIPTPTVPGHYYATLRVEGSAGSAITGQIRVPVTIQGEFASIENVAHSPERAWQQGEEVTLTADIYTRDTGLPVFLRTSVAESSAGQQTHTGQIEDRVSRGFGVRIPLQQRYTVQGQRTEQLQMETEVIRDGVVIGSRSWRTPVYPQPESAVNPTDPSTPTPATTASPDNTPTEATPDTPEAPSLLTQPGYWAMVGLLLVAIGLGIWYALRKKKVLSLLITILSASLLGQSAHAQIPDMTPYAWTFETQVSETYLNPSDPFFAEARLQVTALNMMNTSLEFFADYTLIGTVVYFTAAPGAPLVQESLLIDPMDENRFAMSFSIPPSTAGMLSDGSYTLYLQLDMDVPGTGLRSYGLTISPYHLDTTPPTVQYQYTDQAMKDAYGPSASTPQAPPLPYTTANPIGIERLCTDPDSSGVIGSGCSSVGGEETFSLETAYAPITLNACDRVNNCLCSGSACSPSAAVYTQMYSTGGETLGDFSLSTEGYSVQGTPGETIRASENMPVSITTVVSGAAPVLPAEPCAPAGMVENGGGCQPARLHCLVIDESGPLPLITRGTYDPYDYQGCTGL